MEVVPDALRGVFFAWAVGFGETVFPKFVTLLLGALLTTGRRTVSRVVFVVGELADADPSSYHEILLKVVFGEERKKAAYPAV